MSEDVTWAALRGMVEYGILEVVHDDPDPAKVIYRMIDPAGVGRALADLGLIEPDEESP